MESLNAAIIKQEKADMLKHLSWKPLCAIAVCAALVSYHSVAGEQHPPAAIRALDKEAIPGKSFMHAKLVATHWIIDGLAFEDFADIEAGADELLRMTELASWKVRRDPLYMHYSADFERTSLRLRDAARARSIEKAAFAYMHLTVSCTTCHQHVRNVVQMAPAVDANRSSIDRVIIR